MDAPTAQDEMYYDKSRDDFTGSTFRVERGPNDLARIWCMAKILDSVKNARPSREIPPAGLRRPPPGPLVRRRERPVARPAKTRCRNRESRDGAADVAARSPRGRPGAAASPRHPRRVAPAVSTRSAQVRRGAESAPAITPRRRRATPRRGNSAGPRRDPVLGPPRLHSPIRRVFGSARAGSELPEFSKTPNRRAGRHRVRVARVHGLHPRRAGPRGFWGRRLVGDASSPRRRVSARGRVFRAALASPRKFPRASYPPPGAPRRCAARSTPRKDVAAARRLFASARRERSAERLGHTIAPRPAPTTITT